MFKGNPFYLDETQSAWVEDTFASMSEEEKIGQLLCPSMMVYTTEQAEQFTKEYKVGGFLLRPQALEDTVAAIAEIQQMSRIPLLVSCNIEAGGSGAFKGGSSFATPMGCGATGDAENGYRLGRISCGEAGAVGFNWGYAPLVDIDMSYRNPITNTRAFSSDPDTVIEMARGYLRGAENTGVIPTLKHYPGDGTDERDQHIVVSVNRCSYEEWMNTYGRVYRTLISEGARSIMIGHIAQPAVARALCPEISDSEAYLPASLSKTLTQKMLRDTLGFGGLAVTDSSLMIGFMQKMPRRKAVPTAIESGVDMILFSRNVQEDLRFIREGLADGTLSRARFEEAVKRVLALKASERLYEKREPQDIHRLTSREQTEAWTRECADKAITLVKNKDVLPLSVQRTPRIYLNVIERSLKQSSFARSIKERLEAEGFAVTLRNRNSPFDAKKMLAGDPEMEEIRQEIFADTEEFVSKYDLAVIVVKLPPSSNITTVRVDWKVYKGLGNDFPWYAGEMPILCVSVANPYHLLDIPMADAYINTYSYNKETLDALIEKIMGRSTFKGISPVDATCGMEDTMI